MPLADRRPETYRNIPVLRFRMLVWGHLLQSTQRKSARSKPPNDATYDSISVTTPGWSRVTTAVLSRARFGPRRNAAKPTTTRIALEARHRNNTYYASVRKLRWVSLRVEVRRSRPSRDSKK